MYGNEKSQIVKDSLYQWFKPKTQVHTTLILKTEGMTSKRQNGRTIQNIWLQEGEMKRNFSGVKNI